MSSGTSDPQVSRLKLRPATSPRAFYVGLYQEYLEEASFLYEQRMALLKDPEITWSDIGDFEERFEAHISGLVVGEDLALDVCKKQALEGDFGELHAAVRVFCRQNRLDLLVEVLRDLDPADADRMRAVSDALNHELPESWRSSLLSVLPDPQYFISARLIGYRRWKDGLENLHAMTDRGGPYLPTVLWAVGRLRNQEASIPFLAQFLQHEEPSMPAAVLALLRLGDTGALDRCLRVAESQAWSLIPIGLGAGRPASALLLDIARKGKPHQDCLIALGLLGDTAAVETLFGFLGDSELGEAAAVGLYLITGAQVEEQAVAPEEIDKDELFEEELGSLSAGKNSTGPSGRPLGSTITRLSQKADDWSYWWKTNKARFNPVIRYRSGKPYSPRALLDNLESESFPKRMRSLAYEELVIRYGVDFPLEPDMFVFRQRQALGSYAKWIRANPDGFREGCWYFAGRLLPDV